MNEQHRSVVVIGLPGSGKTTFLAALWHLVSGRELNTRLSFDKLLSGDATYLNSIAERWRSGKEQDRTFLNGNQLVSINLKDQNDSSLQVTFPDIAGEEFCQMWEARECDNNVAGFIKEGGVLLFVHADKIIAPQWVVDLTAMSKKLGLDIPDGQPIPWHPRYAPTQVQIVGLLSLLRKAPLDTGPRRVAVMLSAWDKAKDEQLTPDAFLEAKLPLLNQYLQQEADGWEWRIYGVSAQGDDYDKPDTKSPSAKTEALLDLDYPSTRIQLVSAQSQSHDLTEPLEWLIN